MKNFEIVRSQKGGKKIIYGWFLYMKEGIKYKEMKAYGAVKVK